MKWTAGSVMAAMVVLYGAYAFWPAVPVRGPVLSPVIAQEKSTPVESKKKKKESTGKAAVATISKNDATQEVELRLTEKIPADFDKPLQDFLDQVGKEAKVDFYLDRNALDDSGIARDKPVTIHLKSIRIDKMLDLALGQLNLFWIPRDGYVLVTTRDVLEQSLETRVYNCRDLVEMAVFGTSGEGSGMGLPGAEGGYGAMPGAMSGYGGLGGGGPGSMPGIGMSGAPGATSGLASGAMMPGGGMPGPGMGMPGMPGMSGGGMAMGAASPEGMMGGMSGPMGGGMDMSGATMLPYMGTLIQVITTTVMPESWTEAGGSGSVAAYHNGLLVVNHHPLAHRKIEQLLRMLRDASKDRPGTVVRER